MKARWPVSDRAARAMYVGGRANADAVWFARLWGSVFGLGLFPRRWVALEVPGRRSGRVLRVPLGMADVDGQWYLVSMLGEHCNWVQNALAAHGRVTLQRGRRTQCVLVEVPVADRAPILRRYVQKVPGGRPHIPVRVGASLAEFEDVSHLYPVFAVHRDTASGLVALRVRRLRSWTIGTGIILMAMVVVRRVRMP